MASKGWRQHLQIRLPIRILEQIRAYFVCRHVRRNSDAHVEYLPPEGVILSRMRGIEKWLKPKLLTSHYWSRSDLKAVRTYHAFVDAVFEAYPAHEIRNRRHGLPPGQRTQRHPPGQRRGAGFMTGRPVFVLTLRAEVNTTLGGKAAGQAVKLRASCPKLLVVGPGASAGPISVSYTPDQARAGGASEQQIKDAINADAVLVPVPMQISITPAGRAALRSSKT